MKDMSSTIVILNGASSAGKSSLAHAFQAQSSRQWVRLSVDDAFDAFPAGANLHTVPYDRLRRVFYQQIALWAAEGFDLIVDTVFEEPGCVRKVAQHLHPYTVYLVGLHCPLAELQRREAARGNRPVGLAQSQFDIVHSYCSYDLELNSGNENLTAHNAQAVAELLQQPPHAFDKLQQAQIGFGFQAPTRRAG